MKIFPFLLACSFIISCGSQSRSVQDSLVVSLPENSMTQGLLSNPSFEEGVEKGWKSDIGMQGGISVVRQNFHGANALQIRSTSVLEGEFSQDLAGLTDGIYTLSAFVKNSGGQEYAYLFAEGCGGKTKVTSFPTSEEWVKVTVRGIQISGGFCSVGMRLSSYVPIEINIDDVVFSKDDRPYEFLMGGDISELNFVESKGAKFFDSGHERDPVAILAESGFNFVRLRAFNDPGNENFSPSNKLPSGFQTTADILSLALRAKEAGMSIQLTLNYSDFWADGSIQDIPHEWLGMSYDQIKVALYNYTYDVVSRLVEQGTPPNYVSLGNQMQMGILRDPTNHGGYENWENLSGLLNAGYSAVKDASVGSKVMLHTSSPADKWFFEAAQEHGVKFDVIGMSWYPFWERHRPELDTIPDLVIALNSIASEFNKDIVIMETAVPFSPVLSSGYIGQLANNGSVQYPMSPEGQRDFMYELINALKGIENGRCVGVLYWDPVMVNQEGVGWMLNQPNVVDNATVFDWSHEALPILKQAFKFN